MNDDFTLIHGDALTVLKTMPSESVQTCVTSPPYFGLRDYGIDGQIGLEETPQLFVRSLVEVFREVRRVLREDGTAWLNLGDSYAGLGSGRWGGGNIPATENYKPKDLMGIPWRVAFALQDDGWWLRQDIIWNKPNPMPESVTDRCTKSHEYIFLLSKSAKYYFDQDAIKEPIKDVSVQRLLTESPVVFGGNNHCPDTRLQSGKEWKPKGRDRSNGNRNGLGASTLDQKNLSVNGRKNHSFHESRVKGYEHRGNGDKPLTGHSGNFDANGELIGDGTANKKSVWTVTTQPFKDAHFATFPPKLIEPCILAGSREGDTVLDPFSGAGTTGLVSLRHKRKYVGIELNPDYIAITEKRLAEIQVNLF
jgi:DNA modification methylase